MGFNEDLQQLSTRIISIKDTIQTEEATKMSMIVPFFQLLGYDVFNPNEFCPEFTADIGVKKGEKVDYAIIINGDPSVLVECKWCGDTLDKHGSQLFRYFGTTTSKFGILTNGIIYRFFTDLDESNKMDLTPFLEINMVDLKENQIAELKKFSKQSFDRDSIFSTASDLKYTNLIKDVLKSDMDNPSDDFVRYLLATTYEGQKKQTVVDRFRPIVKKYFSSFVNDLVNNRISAALNKEELDEDISLATEITIAENKVVTTQEELEAFYVVRSILSEITDVENIVFRDAERYFSILFQDNNRKPICRLNLDSKKKQILIQDESKSFVRYYLDSMSAIYKYKKELIESAKRYITE